MERGSGSRRHLGSNGPRKPYGVTGAAKALKRQHLCVECGKYTGQGCLKGGSRIKKAEPNNRTGAANHRVTSAQSTHKPFYFSFAPQSFISVPPAALQPRQSTAGQAPQTAERCRGPKIAPATWSMELGLETAPHVLRQHPLLPVLPRQTSV